MTSDVQLGRALGRALQEPMAFRSKVRLAAEIFTTYGRVRVLLARRRLPDALASLRRRATIRPEVTLEDQVAGMRLGLAVQKALSPLPFDSRCLAQSLVLTAMLARRGIDGKLVIGVEPGPAFAAHAWVEAEGIAMLPVEAERYSRIAEL